MSRFDYPNSILTCFFFLFNCLVMDLYYTFNIMVLLTLYNFLLPFTVMMDIHVIWFAIFVYAYTNFFMLNFFLGVVTGVPRFVSVVFRSQGSGNLGYGYLSMNDFQTCINEVEILGKTEDPLHCVDQTIVNIHDCES